MEIGIKDIQYQLPEFCLTNEIIGRENPSWDMDLVSKRSGVITRHIARKDETAFDLALEACEKLLDRHENARNRIDGILFCTQSRDYIMPSNACILQNKLGLSESVFALDYSLVCVSVLLFSAQRQERMQLMHSPVVNGSDSPPNPKF